MPTALSLPLRLARALPQAGGEPHRALNALFYHWLEAAELRLAKFVHEQADPKPFTLSPLIADGNDQFHFRVTLLEDEYGPYVADGMKRERTVRIGNQIFELAGDPTIEHCRYAELAESTDNKREIILRFDSPTSFRSDGLDYPLPDPRRVFQSYLTRWNAFSGMPIEPFATFLEWVASCVAVSRFELKTETFKFESHVQIGCVGQIHYQVAKRAAGDADLIRWLNVLADYAAYCGTGHKTAQGMGQTRRVV